MDEYLRRIKISHFSYTGCRMLADFMFSIQCCNQVVCRQHMCFL